VTDRAFHTRKHELSDDPAVDPSQIVAELARVKALFQARTIALVIGAQPPDSLPAIEPDKANP